MVRLITKLPPYKTFRVFGFPHKLPLSLTLTVTNRCSCRCKTCNIYQHPCDELSSEEIKRIFSRFGSRIYWLTLSGGEPFVRDDFEEICVEACRFLKPSFVTIPTNGMLPEVIPQVMDSILSSCQKTHFIVNLSVDGLSEQHDYIRGGKNSYQRAMETYERLKLRRAGNMTIGIHTAVSRYNAKDFQGLLAHITALHPDSYIVEYAQGKAELHNEDGNFQAGAEEYEQCIKHLLRAQKTIGSGRIPRYIKILRKQYYELTKKVVRERRCVLPCYAGFSSAHIAADGEVWACGVKAFSMGNLRNTDYVFKGVWHNEQADSVRARIRKQECCCTSANIQYQNMLFHFPSFCKLLADYCLS